jgi:hypothetical protein
MIAPKILILFCRSFIIYIGSALFFLQLFALFHYILLVEVKGLIAIEAW